MQEAESELRPARRRRLPSGRQIGGSMADKANVTEDEKYWSEHWQDRPYVRADRSWDDYLAAFRMGWESHEKYSGRDFSQIEDELKREWDQNRGGSKLSWDEARNACCDAWGRCAQPCDQADTQPGAPPMPPAGT